MPIRPENKHLYPKNWPKIRCKILARAACCESCGVKNYERGIRDKKGTLWPLDGLLSVFEDTGSMIDGKVIKIVLTIAHLDHDPTNNDHENLRALCQKCHNNHDAEHRAKNRKKNREANFSLFDHNSNQRNCNTTEER